jgi:signal transduction histidine kinase
MRRLQVKSAFEELGFLTARLEHELHNPIGTMDSHISLMRQQFHDDVEILGFLESLEEQLGRIQASLAIIPLFRGDAEYFRHLMRRTDLRNLIDHAIKSVKRGSKLAESITFRVNVGSLVIRVYPEMIEQAL